jgi:hypothetical protein
MLVLPSHLRHPLLVSLTVEVGIVVVHLSHLLSPVVSTGSPEIESRQRGGTTRGYRKMRSLTYACICRVFISHQHRSVTRYPKSGSIRSMSHDPVPFWRFPFELRTVFGSETTKATRVGRPLLDVAITLPLVGAPPVKGFLGVDSAITPLRRSGHSGRGGADVTTIRREIEHMSYLLSPK